MNLLIWIFVVLIVSSISVEERKSSSTTIVVQLWVKQSTSTDQKGQNILKQINNLKQIVQANLSISLFSDVSTNQLSQLLSLEIKDYKNLKIMGNLSKPRASISKFQLLKNSSEVNPLSNQIFWISLNASQMMKQIQQIEELIKQEHTFYITVAKKRVDKQINIPFYNNLLRIGQVTLLGGKVEAIPTVINLQYDARRLGKKDDWSEEISLCFLAQLVPQIISKTSNNHQIKQQKKYRHRIAFDNQLKFKKQLIYQVQKTHYQKLKIKNLDYFVLISKNRIYFYFELFGFLTVAYIIGSLLAKIVKKCCDKQEQNSVSGHSSIKTEQKVSLHQLQ